MIGTRIQKHARNIQTETETAFWCHAYQVMIENRCNDEMVSRLEVMPAEIREPPLSGITATCDRTLRKAIKSDPDGKVMTFGQPLAETRTGMADSGSCIFVCGLVASARDIDLSGLTGKVPDRYQADFTLSGTVIRQRQALAAILETGKTIDEISASQVTLVMSS